IDVGVGDIIVPHAEKRYFQPQLEGYSAPEILTYSLDSTIAEKFDAILQRFELTGRMKDFYDIYFLSQCFNFDGFILQQAIKQTIVNRGTEFNQGSLSRLSALSEDSDMLTKWRYFLKTIDNQFLSFSEIIIGIELFLRPICDAIINETDCLLHWSSSDKAWN
ncbi:MAG TPA: nucleotidyltransferase, partial [Clostridiales bacterium]|nr:nucleotidyltransferase [Clostridiales bacterium]